MTTNNDLAHELKQKSPNWENCEFLKGFVNFLLRTPEHQLLPPPLPMLSFNYPVNRKVYSFLIIKKDEQIKIEDDGNFSMAMASGSSAGIKYKKKIELKKFYLFLGNA